MGQFWTPIPPSRGSIFHAESHHYHLDHLGSPQTITDGAATIVRQTRYHPYGQVRGRWLAAGDAEQDRREFTGYYHEPLSELDYAGARFYDPTLATFLTHDPAGQFASPYAYGAWSPLNGRDPTGTFWFLAAGITSEFLLKAAAVGFIAGFAAQSIQAAVNGASVGDALAAGVNGGAAGALSAGVGLLFLEPALGALLAVLSEPARDLAGPALFVSGLGQAAYGLSQGDYSAVIGLGVSIGVAFAIAQGGNGVDVARSHPLDRVAQLESTAQDFDQRFGVGDLRLDASGYSVASSAGCSANACAGPLLLAARAAPILFRAAQHAPRLWQLVASGTLVKVHGGLVQFTVQGNYQTALRWFERIFAPLGTVQQQGATRYVEIVRGVAANVRPLSRFHAPTLEFSVFNVGIKFRFLEAFPIT